MQDEALADSRAALDADAGDAYTVWLHRPEWHQGVDRHRRVAPQGPVSPARHRFRARRRRRARGSGRSIAGFHLRDALDLVAKRAPGDDHPLRRPRVRRGPSSCRGRAAAISSRRSRPWRVSSFARAICAASTKATARLTPGELTFALGTTMGERVWGQGFPRRRSTTCSTSSRSASVGDGHARLDAGARRRALRRRSRSARRAAAAANPRAVSGPK